MPIETKKTGTEEWAPCMKPTPGPWVRDGHYVYGPKHIESKHPNGRVLIAQVFQGSRRAVPHLDGGADRFGFNSECDVDLITAAPELLAILKEALNESGCGGGSRVHAWREKARAIIARIPGED